MPRTWRTLGIAFISPDRTNWPASAVTLFSVSLCAFRSLHDDRHCVLLSSYRDGYITHAAHTRARYDLYFIAESKFAVSESTRFFLCINVA